MRSIIIDSLSVLSPRPSKLRFYLTLRKHLKSKQNNISADIASNNFYNMSFFDTELYIGIDIDRNSLKEGVDIASKKTNTPDSVAIQSDLSQNIPLKSHTVDNLVCSHTLSHLPEEEWDRVVRELIRVTDVGGNLALNYPSNKNKQDSIIALLTDSFVEVEVLLYRNKLSVVYENLASALVKKQFTHPVLNYAKPIKSLISAILYVLSVVFLPMEYLSNSNNKMCAIFCYAKKGARRRQDSNLGPPR